MIHILFGPSFDHGWLFHLGTLWKLGVFRTLHLDFSRPTPPPAPRASSHARQALVPGGAHARQGLLVEDQRCRGLAAGGPRAANRLGAGRGSHHGTLPRRQASPGFTEEHAAGGWLVGWLGGWVGGWVGGWLVGWVGGWVGGWLVGWVVGWVFGCLGSFLFCRLISFGLAGWFRFVGCFVGFVSFGLVCLVAR